MRRLPVTIAFLAAIAVLVVAIAAQAADGAQAILTLVVNTVQRGEATVLLEGSDVLVTPADLSRAGIQHLPAGRVETRGGVAYRSLASLSPRLKYVLDEPNLVLALTVAPALLENQQVDMAPGRPHGVAYHRDTSGFLNYSLQLLDGVHVNAFTEAGLSVSGNLVYASATATSDAGAVRNLTSFTFDDRPRLMRWTLGDAFVSGGPLGGASYIGGLTVARSWEIDPYYVRAPSIGYAGAVATPSVLEVYVNGVLQRREPLAPGPFQVQNLNVPTGAGTVQYIVRDAFGSEHAVASPYYAAPGVLARGLSEFCFTLGLVRSNVGTRSFDYGPPGLLARYRYAFTNAVTAGARLELGTDFASFGVTSSLALPIGELDLGAAGSFSAAGGGAAALAGYSYVGRRASVSIFVQGSTPRYTMLAQRAGDDRDLVTAGASTSVALGRRVSVSAQQVLSRYRDAGTNARSSAVLNLQIAKGVGLFVAAGRTVTPGLPPAFDASVMLNVAAGGNVGLTAGARADGGGRELFAGIDKPLPAGNGVGFRASGALGDHTRGDVLLTAQSPWGTYLANYQNVDGEQHGMLQVAGGIVALEGAGVFFTRPVQSGFAVIEVPGAAGVRGTLENQEIGRTSGSGMLVVPNVAPYYGNRLGIVDTDLPLDFTVAAVEQVIAPPLRGGALVRFEVQRAHFVRGRLVVRAGGAQAAAFGELTLRATGRDLTSPLGGHGEFEFSDLGPGHYEAEAVLSSGRCAMTLVVPESSRPVIDVGEVPCEQR